MKKILAMILAGAMMLSMGACSNEAPAEKPAETPAAPSAPAAPATPAAPSAEGKTVGVAMPTQSSERWINDGANMKAQLEALGY